MSTQQVDIGAVKAVLDLRHVVMETHDLTRDGKVLCPWHDERTPSCHIYRDGYRCFGCGAHGDVVDWLGHVLGVSTAEAIAEGGRRSGQIKCPAKRVSAGFRANVRQGRQQGRSTKPPLFTALSGNVLDSYYRKAARLDRVPTALQGRGFTLEDCLRLTIADCNGDALFPVDGPSGEVYAIKRRTVFGRPRYRYVTPDRGAPAWCSPRFADADEVLIVEGELNGMACWLACPELGVMGMPGTSGKPYTEALVGKVVHVYGDGDRAGQAARERWAAEAYRVARKVYVLEAWEYDACEVTGRWGRGALAERLAS